MKRRLLTGLAVLAALFAVAAGWVAWLNLRGESAPAVAVTAPADARQQLARGAYLARVGNCAGCHSERGGPAFAGGHAIATPFGTVYAGNLTPDPEHGLGRWTADDFWRALHNGRSRDGRLLYPAFPYPNYTQVTREDSDALFAWLRSLPPVARPDTPHDLRWPFSTQWALAVWRALYFTPAGAAPGPERGRSAEWQRGAYLVRGLGHCSACHSNRNALGATSDVLDLSGGLIPMQNWYAPSLASPQEAGVAGWEPAQVEKLLVTGVSPRGSVLGPMAEVVLESTQYLTPEDAHAMAVFLKDLPPPQGDAGAEAPPPRRAGAGTLERGERLYGQHCAQCHGDDGRGVPGAYPALAGNRAVLMASSANLVQVVLGGGFAPATAGNPRPFGMPPFATALSDADVAAVISYLRSAWGNRAGAVSELDVAQQRGSP
ncbi:MULTISPECIES: cytochrome c [Ramlibacter]|uniref:Cytochrome c n=1 Tax=Ramlibacter aquaticus TaxID=2780094 RepID=A0ABR9SB45_9BURK|nr:MULTISPECIES: cytochrome c [Ramlibacter]MBE7939017.1 cytochrome c [Ramlibacter aquaticus]